jgi:hypothetical protein
MLLSSSFTHASSWATRRTGLASSLSFSPTRARVLSGPGQGGPGPLPWSVRSLPARRPSSFLLPFSQGQGAHEDVGVGRNGRGEARRTLCPSWAIRARSRVLASRDVEGHGGGKEERREGGQEGGKVGMEPGANGQHQQAEFLNDFLVGMGAREGGREGGWEGEMGGGREGGRRGGREEAASKRATSRVDTCHLVPSFFLISLPPSLPPSLLPSGPPCRIHCRGAPPRGKPRRAFHSSRCPFLHHAPRACSFGGVKGGSGGGRGGGRPSRVAAGGL